jgi:hypothetical protein
VPALVTPVGKFSDTELCSSLTMDHTPKVIYDIRSA